MQISRRKFLTCSATTALLLSQPVSLLGRTKENREDIRVLIAETNLAKQIQEYLPHYKSIGLDTVEQHSQIVDVKSLRSWIANSAGQKLIGVVSNEFYPVLETLLREVGGASLFHGRHTVTAKGWSRHKFYTVPGSQGAAQYFTASLGTGSRISLADECCFGAVEKVDQNNQNLNVAPNWFAAVAGMMVSIASDRWVPGVVKQYPLAMGDESLKAVAGIETFVFKV